MKAFIFSSFLIITSVLYGQNKLVIDESIDSETREHLNEFAENNQFFELVSEDVDSTFLFKSSDTKLQLFTPEGELVFQVPKINLVDLSKREEFFMELEALAPILFLRSVEMRVDEFDVTINIIPMKLRQGAEGKSLKDFEQSEVRYTYTPGQPIPQIPEGTIAMFEFVNNANSPIYYSLVNVSPDYEVTVLFPQKNQSPVDCRLEEGENYIPSFVFQVGEPYGIDILKIIVSNKPIQLSEKIIKTRGKGDKSDGAESPFEAILRPALQGVKTRGKNSSEALSISSFRYEIVKAE